MLRDQISCPLCNGKSEGCTLCGGTGIVPLEQIHRLAEQVKRVVDLMQVGDADGAAEAARITVRLARLLLPQT
jgi:hypothetical protein